MKQIRFILLILLVSFVAVNSCKKKSSNTTQTLPYKLTYFSNDSVKAHVITAIAELDNGDEKVQIRGRFNLDETYYLSSFVFVNKKDGSKRIISRDEQTECINYSTVDANGNQGNVMIEFKQLNKDSLRIRFISVDQGDYNTEHELIFNSVSNVVTTVYKQSASQDQEMWNGKEWVKIIPGAETAQKIADKINDVSTKFKDAYNNLNKDADKIKNFEPTKTDHNPDKDNPDIDYNDNITFKITPQVVEKLYIKAISKTNFVGKDNEWLDDNIVVQVVDDKGLSLEGIYVKFKMGEPYNLGQINKYSDGAFRISAAYQIADDEIYVPTNSNGYASVEFMPSLHGDPITAVRQVIASIDPYANRIRYSYKEATNINFDVAFTDAKKLKITKLNRTVTSPTVNIEFDGGKAPYNITMYNGWSTQTKSTSFNTGNSFDLKYDGLYKVVVVDANGFRDSLEDSVENAIVTVSAKNSYMVINVKSSLGLLPVFLIPKTSGTLLSRLINASNNNFNLGHDMSANETDYCINHYGTSPKLDFSTFNTTDGSTDYAFRLYGNTGSYSMSIRFQNNLKHGWHCNTGTFVDKQYWTDTYTFNYTLP